MFRRRIDNNKIIVLFIIIIMTMNNILVLTRNNNKGLHYFCNSWMMPTTTTTSQVSRHRGLSSLIISKDNSRSSIQFRHSFSHPIIRMNTSPSSSSSSSETNNVIDNDKASVINDNDKASVKSSSGGGGRVSNAVRDENLLQKTSSSDTTTTSTKAKVIEKLNTAPVKGTRDFYPDDMLLRNWLFQQWKDVAKLYGFIEYDSPILEYETLYTRKAGDEVVQQLYNFIDKGERKVSLRPEMTPSLARMIMSKKNTISFPIKWFSIPQCWRYERMTRGRRREHYQWNMDIWGDNTNIVAEIELISAMIYFLKKVGITSTDVGIKINSRLVINEVLSKFGIPDYQFASICVLIDKLDKVPIETIQDELIALDVNKDIINDLLLILSNKSLDTLKDTLGEESIAIQQLTEFFKLCNDYDIADWIQFDASVIRGLSYYTGIVFEAFDKKGILRAIAGGGRYDTLLKSFDSTSDIIPAVGFGFGDAVIIELLNDRQLIPKQFINDSIDFVIYAMSNEYYSIALQVANTLRYESNKSVDVILDYNTKKTKAVFKQADRVNAEYCIIIGQTEYENQMLSIKNLKLGTQESIKINTIIDWVENNNNNKEKENNTIQ